MPAQPAETEFAMLTKTMRDHLSPKPLVIAEQFKFHKRNQHEGESVVRYLAALRKLAEKCGFNDFLDQALHDKLVCGLWNENIPRKPLAEADLTLKQVFEVAQRMEATHYKASELQVSDPPQDVHSVSALKPGLGVARPITRQKGVISGHKLITSVENRAMWQKFVVERGNQERRKRKNLANIYTKKIILSWGCLRLRLLTVYRGLHACAQDCTCVHAFHC